MRSFADRQKNLPLIHITEGCLNIETRLFSICMSFGEDAQPLAEEFGTGGAKWIATQADIYSRFTALSFPGFAIVVETPVLKARAARDAWERQRDAGR